MGQAAVQDDASGGTLGSAEANRRFYETQAEIYDETEFCANDPAPRQRLREALERALALVGDSPRVLDAGGGTGNASLILRDLGVQSTLIDASPEMLGRWTSKAAELGIEPACELVDIEAFFDHDEREWDLIVFSSVLHHLEDPASVLISAGGRVAPGGVIVTIFDPLQMDGIGHFLRRLDYACWIAIHDPGTLFRAIARKVRARVRPQAQEPHIGALAERHAMSGLDDGSIAGGMRASGFAVITHDRVYDARYGALATLSRLLRRPTHFSFLFQRRATN